MLKGMVNDNIRNKMNLGCHLDGYDDRISNIFLLPSREVAEANFLARVHCFLTRRFHNLKMFTLTPIPVPINNNAEGAPAQAQTNA